MKALTFAREFAVYFCECCALGLVLGSVLVACVVACAVGAQ